MTDVATLQQRIGEVIRTVHFDYGPPELYDPIHYTLSLGGKRLRPLLTLIACELFGGNTEEAIQPAVGLELFHNFTLLHDDIMDLAPLRRGKPTVYRKWNTNRAILSGDTLFVLAYEKICMARPEVLPDVLSLFNTTARQVCEGQQLDMNFETRQDVTIEDYLEMIRLKTAVLIACSLKLGALMAGASREDTSFLYRFGENLGMAFQLQDDYLDVFGQLNKFGKQIGGDIIARKKTYLYLKAAEKARGDDLSLLGRYYSDDAIDDEERVHGVTGLYTRLGVDTATREIISQYSGNAMNILGMSGYSAERRETLGGIVSRMVVREF